ncbi:hypothetical protein LTR08_008830 [Meristemomyces frigidus]|nr:hypothetical protein LTR08_008830 [Meristemomyces frigidus]
MPVEATTTGPQRLQPTSNGQNQEDSHERTDSHHAIMELGRQVQQARFLNAQSKEAMGRLSDHKTQEEAAQNEHKASEIEMREYEVRIVEVDAEVQRLRRQTAEAEGRAVDLGQQHERAQKKAERTEDEYTKSMEVVARAEGDFSTIAEKLKEVKRALGID